MTNAYRPPTVGEAARVERGRAVCALHPDHGMQDYGTSGSDMIADVLHLLCDTLGYDPDEILARARSTYDHDADDA